MKPDTQERIEDAKDLVVDKVQEKAKRVSRMNWKRLGPLIGVFLVMAVSISFINNEQIKVFAIVVAFIAGILALKWSRENDNDKGKN